MKSVLLILFNLIFLSAFAQKSDTLFSYANLGAKAVKKDQPVNVYKVFKRDSTSWVRITSDHNLLILKKETYSDPELKILHGGYTLFNNGKPIERGVYVKGNRSGNWTRLDSAGKITETETYADDMLNGKYTAYWPDEKVKIDGNYLNNQKTRTWKVFYETGILAANETYDERGRLLSGEYFDAAHQAILRDQVKTEAEYPGGINQFYAAVSKNIKYPQDARNPGISGIVNFIYTVDSSGNLSEIEIISSPGKSFSDELIRVLHFSKKWKPATLFGKTMESHYNARFNFMVQ